MRTTITIRADKDLRRKLSDHAEAGGMSLSAYIRSILESAVAESTVQDRAGHLKGCLRLPRNRSSSWRREIRERNWRS